MNFDCVGGTVSQTWQAGSYYYFIAGPAKIQSEKALPYGLEHGGLLDERFHVFHEKPFHAPLQSELVVGLPAARDGEDAALGAALRDQIRGLSRLGDDDHHLRAEYRRQANGALKECDLHLPGRVQLPLVEEDRLRV